MGLFKSVESAVWVLKSFLTIPNENLSANLKHAGSKLVW
jgi:hypothetical protein